MARLRERHAEFGLQIQFDEEGRIDVTPETCVDIITALLDHRLSVRGHQLTCPSADGGFEFGRSARGHGPDSLG